MIAVVKKLQCIYLKNNNIFTYFTDKHPNILDNRLSRF